MPPLLHRAAIKITKNLMIMKIYRKFSLKYNFLVFKTFSGLPHLISYSGARHSASCFIVCICAARRHCRLVAVALERLSCCNTGISCWRRIQNLKPRLHSTTGCQTGCQTSLTTGLTTALTTGCIV